MSNLVLLLIDFLLDVILLGLERSRVLILTVLLLELVELTVEAVNLVLFLGDCDMALLDVALELLDLAFFLLKLVNEIIKLLLKQLILRLCVEVVDADTRYLVSDVFDLDFFLGDLLVSDLGLLYEVGARLLDGLLL